MSWKDVVKVRRINIDANFSETRTLLGQTLKTICLQQGSKVHVYLHSYSCGFGIVIVETVNRGTEQVLRILYSPRSLKTSVMVPAPFVWTSMSTFWEYMQMAPLPVQLSLTSFVHFTVSVSCPVHPTRPLQTKWFWRGVPSMENREM